MPSVSKVSPQGEISIPENVRKKVNLHPGDEVEFRVEGEKVVLLKKNSKKRFFSCCGAVKMTTEDHDKLLDQIHPTLE